MREPTARSNEVLELDGPPMAYFEIPLDYFATPNGEIEPEGHPQASRLRQEVFYQSVWVGSAEEAGALTGIVKLRLVMMGGGLLWWRRRWVPTNARTLIRLGTSPSLHSEWWKGVFEHLGLTGG